MRVSGNFFAIVSICLWCFSGVCFRKGADLIGEMPFLVFATGGGGICAICFNLFLGRSLRTSIFIPFRVVVSGFFGVAVYTIALGFAFGMAEEADLGLINLINYLWPMWMALFGLLLLKEDIQPSRILLVGGIICGLVGLVISRGSSGLAWPENGVFPHCLALFGGMLWALYSVLLKRWEIAEESGGAGVHFLVCALLSFVIAKTQGNWMDATQLTGEALFWIFFCACGPVGIAYFLWELGVKRGSVSLIASLSYFIPVGSSFVLGVLFRETLNWGLLPGAAMVAIGAWLINKSSSRAQETRTDLSPE